VAQAGELDAIDARVRQRVVEASQFAEAGEPADEGLVFDLMFVDQHC
jgi:TPP-dependent pyruvate/acetoin dehydrogenase alpha subunit